MTNPDDLIKRSDALQVCLGSIDHKELTRAINSIPAASSDKGEAVVYARAKEIAYQLETNHKDMMLTVQSVKDDVYDTPLFLAAAEPVLLNNMTNTEEYIKAYLKQSVPKGMAEGFRALMTSPNINEIVGRFLSWKLPSDFSPDSGISFKPWSDNPIHHPTGTNLLNADQAKAMFGYVLAGAHVELFTAPQQAIPAGWKLVPIEPTLQMDKAAVDADLASQDGQISYADIYKAMLSAAPTAPIDNVREVLEAKAKMLYGKSTDNHPTIHCNRFPLWEELDQATKAKWLEQASTQS
jgi:hypothetical protein